jgi:hypothetical protein
MPSPSAATLGVFVKRLKDYEQDVSDNVERHTVARMLKEAANAGTALVRPLAASVVLPATLFNPDQQTVSDVTQAHRYGIKPRHADAAALRALVNAADDVNVLPRVIRAMDGTAAEATRKLKALYIASRVGPIGGFRGPAAGRAAKMDEMRRLSGEFDRRLAGARAEAQKRVAKATRAHRSGRGKRRTRKGKKRTRHSLKQRSSKRRRRSTRRRR